MLTWQLTDFDCATSFGQPLSGHFSESFIPPEYMMKLLPFRVEGGWGGVPPPLDAADASFDVWSYGVILYELCTGMDLFSQDKNENRISTRKECEQLAAWKEPTPNQLSFIFEHASGTTSTARLLAQDLVSFCLRGDELTRPSMDIVLRHPFFQIPQDLLNHMSIAPPREYKHAAVHHPHDRDLTLASVKPHIGALDVVFSYRTAQKEQMWRLRRVLQALGITTADGTQARALRALTHPNHNLTQQPALQLALKCMCVQVPAGQDWRVWYFQRLDIATTFCPILSKEFLESPACLDEAEAALKRTNMSFFPVVVDPESLEEKVYHPHPLPIPPLISPHPLPISPSPYP